MGNSAVLVASALGRISLRRTNVINVMTIITATIRRPMTGQAPDR
jgi:hypothetical protein